jgi:CelD/BcsL family acetyltransferase involved in cellulose biosynthesis
MSALRLLQIASVEELLAAAPAWDDLWRRSDATMPTLRAALLAQWRQWFARGADFRALVVEDGGQWVAALPLVERKIARLFGAGATPSNEWSSSGDLLLEPAAAVEPVLDLLVTAMGQLPWPLLWLDEIPLESPRWLALRQALDRAAVAAEGRAQYSVGRIEIGRDWPAYQRSWSRKHRQKMSWSLRRLESRGGVELVTLADLAPQQVSAWLRQGFDVEDRGWKAREGTSVLRTPRMFSFFVEQATQLARWGQLELHFLQVGAQPVAFAYGCSAKGVFHSCKVGYDPDYAVYSPGQLLRCRMLERFYGEPQRRWLDCQGPMTDAHAAWRPQTYAIGRLAVAPRQWVGRAMLLACRSLGAVRQRKRRKRGHH